jgi:hypothetical protein
MDVRFNNTFVGKLRPLEVEIAGSGYFLTCHDRVNKFLAEVLIGLEIAGFDSVLALKTLPDLKLFDERFADIDLELLPEGMRSSVAAVIFDKLLSGLSAKLKLDISITSIEVCSKFSKGFPKEIGLTVCDEFQEVVVIGNLKLGVDLLKLLIESFEKIPAHCEPRNCGFPFKVFLKAGETTLPVAEFDNLEISDIIFLDDASQLHSGTFTLCGVDSPRVVGNFEGAFFKVSNVTQ